MKDPSAIIGAGAGGTALALQAQRNLRRQTTEGLALGVDDEPIPAHRGGLRKYRAHI